MLVPKATVDEDDEFARWEHKVWPTRQALAVEPEAQTTGVQEPVGKTGLSPSALAISSLSTKQVWSEQGRWPVSPKACANVVAS
jgi:hypothetical protein